MDLSKGIEAAYRLIFSMHEGIYRRWHRERAYAIRVCCKLTCICTCIGHPAASTMSSLSVLSFSYSLRYFQNCNRRLRHSTFAIHDISFFFSKRSFFFLLVLIRRLNGSNNLLRFFGILLYLLYNYVLFNYINYIYIYIYLYIICSINIRHREISTD